MKEYKEKMTLSKRVSSLEKELENLNGKILITSLILIFAMITIKLWL